LSADQYFAAEWEQYRNLGASVRVAASREGAEKVYVQDLIREDKEKICDWIVKSGGHVYICG
jgi:sulfite reductase alpha subunit-like flavoprotein